MPPLISLVGRTFGRLTVLRRAGTSCQKVTWSCRCACGRVVAVIGADMKAGKQQSCGCLQLESVTRHGAFGSPEYRAWQTMRDRCTNPRACHFDQQGGRGITVCDRWLYSFEYFLADLGPRPSLNHVLERIDKDGPYSPENCRWTTRQDQVKRRHRAKPQLRANGRFASGSQEVGRLTPAQS